MTTAAREYHDLSANAEASHSYFEQRMAFTTGPVELQRAIANDEVVVVDVRDAGSFASGHAPGAVNLPKDSWDDTSLLSRDRPNVFICYNEVCHLAAKAALHFSAQGFPAMEMEGGMKVYRDMDMPLESS